MQKGQRERVRRGETGPGAPCPAISPVSPAGNGWKHTPPELKWTRVPSHRSSPSPLLTESFFFKGHVAEVTPSTGFRWNVGVSGILNCLHIGASFFNRIFWR